MDWGQENETKATTSAMVCFSLVTPLLSPFWKYCSRGSLLLYATGRAAVMMMMVLMVVVIVEWLMKVEWQGWVGAFQARKQSSPFWEQNQPITPPTTMPKRNILGTFPGWSAPCTSELWQYKIDPAFKCVNGIEIWDLGTKYGRKSYARKQLMFIYDTNISATSYESAHHNSYGNKGSALPSTTWKVEPEYSWSDPWVKRRARRKLRVKTGILSKYDWIWQ